MTDTGSRGPNWSAASRTITEPALDAAAPLRTWLVYIGSAEDDFGSAGLAYGLDGIDTVAFGRGRGSQLEVRRNEARLDVRPPHGWISSEHAVIERDGDGFVARDLGSRNGIILDETRVREPTAVELGAVIEVGRTFWMLRRCHETVDLGRRFAGLCEVGTSNPSYWSILHSLDRMATANLPLLLTGETGTGKGRMARALHDHGGRPGPMLHLNLAGPRAMEHFRQREPGVLRRATAHGTLLLDDVGELDAAAQTELLSTLVREFDDRARPTTRILSTSSRDLRRMLAQGAFRPDLYARLAGFELQLTPLRDRREDMGRLVSSLLPDEAQLSTAALRRLLSCRWPFNVRQLEQTLGAAFALSTSNPFIDRAAIEKVLVTDSDPLASPEEVRALRARLLDALREHNNDVGAVAGALECSADQVNRWLARFDITLER